MSRGGVGKPDFFIVGAPRCGTTWLYRHLSMHPRVFVSAQKEPHYFNTDSRFRWIETAGDYESLFRDAPADAQAVGEASVLYLHSAVAAANILRYQPQARFIAMVR
ncbi:MAG: sulfotransferase, partial [Rhodanobacteraceae bacterium]